ncbi:phosphoinositide 3-kinase adapter protein 1 isoform X1 [Scleropages formosus]|uniref:phosphoinositide 3-kinase adapter protein 1 isoform X1 n=1 Tax=Scleropages formosus TaxID=113540 RepID=UPI0010FACD3A|nr:phosphoinositide 3-kinase adapter protein 1 isoform X1 [Scleropages formosus]
MSHHLHFPDLDSSLWTYRSFSTLPLCQNHVSKSPFSSATPSTSEVLIVHTSEAEEWAKYLQHVLRSSQMIPKNLIHLYPVYDTASLQEDDYDVFNCSRCIVLLLSMAFLDMQNNPEVLEVLKRLFYPPNKMVLFFCGVSESEMLSNYFEDWKKWRKLYPDDDPAIYISTILESLSDGEDYGTDSKTERQEDFDTLKDLREDAPRSAPTEDPPQALALPEESCGSSTELQIPAMGSDTDLCLTVQPDRILCGAHVRIYIILKCKLDTQAEAYVEFSSEECDAKRKPGKVENEYTVSVNSPAMPSGTVLITVYSSQVAVCTTHVTYFTGMEEVSKYLENIASPMEFMCQAFNVASSTESLDSLLTDLLKSRIPASGLSIFGISHLEQENMSSYQRNDELPTLLHFAAKYGLKKLVTVLLQCPGALQAYSVMNKFGDYPNNIAEKHGFLELRQFMDEYVETAHMLECETVTQAENEDVYECMSKCQDILRHSLNSGCKDDISETTIKMNLDCIEDLYEDMEKVWQESSNTEEDALRKFFQAGASGKFLNYTEEEENTEKGEDEGEENPADELEEPYNFCLSDEIYDTVEFINDTPEILNRPPAPIPRPCAVTESEDTKTYISKVFSEKQTRPKTKNAKDSQLLTGALQDGPQTTNYDPYAGMKTPGQRQLISLQERVKVGAISVEEAVQEFKEWQRNQEKRSQSLRFQQENLKRLRESITRRHKEKVKEGKDIDLEITAPLQYSCHRSTLVKMECAVYEPSPRVKSGATQPIERGSWQSGSTSSTSSTRSNRQSTHSTVSYSSGAENDYEENFEHQARPPCVFRTPEVPPMTPPPPIPRRIPDRMLDGSLQDIYTSSPSRTLPQRPPLRPSSPPPIPRRNW